MCEKEAGCKILLLLFVFCEKQVRKICLCLKKKICFAACGLFSSFYESAAKGSAEIGKNREIREIVSGTVLCNFFIVKFLASS